MPPNTRERNTFVFAKIRRALLGALAQLQLFSYFINPQYKSPKTAYEVFLAGSPPPLSRERFLNSAVAMCFPGRAEFVFETLQDGRGYIHRKTFVKRIEQAQKIIQKLDIAKVVALATAARSGNRLPPRLPKVSSAEQLQKWQTMRQQRVQAARQRWKQISWSSVRRDTNNPQLKSTRKIPSRRISSPRSRELWRASKDDGSQSRWLWMDKASMSSLTLSQFGEMRSAEHTFLGL